ncbi:hypothetical protein, partial [Tenacibaculum maritimum]|uniref:hypothetical protein n=1 Tax=Tenacibaculum maritimum TaxID=107401 RepID=UPI003876BB60
MKVIYIIFFLILNLLIFSFQTERIKFSFNIKTLIIIIELLVIVLHFLGYIKLESNEVFMVLLFFSLGLVLFKIAGELTILFAIKVNKSIQDHFVLKMFNFMINYFVYIMVSIF